MLRYNLSPFHSRPAYSIESYEPIDLLPEEQNQNNFIKLDIISKTSNKNNFHIPHIQNLQNISNYNTQDSIIKNLFGTRPITESNKNNLGDNSHPNNFYSFRNFVNKSPKPVLSPVKMQNHNLIRQKFPNHILNQNSFNYVNNKNIPIVNNFHNIPRVQNAPHLLNRCKSSKFLTHMNHANILQTNNLNNNKILLPIKIRQISPPHIIQKNIPCSTKKVIPIYRKIIYHRKKY